MKPSETSPRPGTATRTTLTRRRLLNTLAVSGVAVVGGGALAASHDPIPAHAAVPYAGGGPDESQETLSGLSATRALHELLTGNKRYTAGHMLHPRQGVQRRAQVAPRQQPLAAILSCADSRVPPEIVFDQGLGDLFVIRVAGNTADDVALGSLEYAVDHLGVHLVLVLGHERCGAVQATHDLLTKGEQLPGHIAALVVPIVPAVQAAQTMRGDVVDNAVTANVRMVTAHVRTTAPILSAHVQKGALKVVGARYDLESGAVTLIA
ncbi:MAG TPA: carbonic anhydrase [Chloroflexota bacterium]|nr:carbonic anhydrase [Chloroflexota bacterium]